jgi:cation diffusion facilitator CzcD-associated flavoprotein CzcO
MVPLDWLIIGGGVHGTHLAVRLLAAGKTSHDRMRVLDPHAEPLACWERCTRNVGMQYLRSPAVHQLDVSPFALYGFIRERRMEEAAVFAPPYNRPSLALFRAHCERLLHEHRLREVWLRGRASALRQIGDVLAVETDRGLLHARRLILAVGLAEQPRWPDWATALRDAGAPIDHVFSPTFAQTATAGHVAVIGGGISAAQLALAYAELQPGRVLLVTHHEPRLAQFDSDPGWLGPRYLTGFRREPDLGRRRRAIIDARHHGSMPEDVHAALDSAAEAGSIRIVRDRVAGGSVIDGLCRLRLARQGDVAAARVVLATGFETHRPGGSWLDETIDVLGLPCAECGYPRIDAALRWHPRIHVSGPLAELEIGPASRNIAGARMAAERLLRAV